MTGMRSLDPQAMHQECDHEVLLIFSNAFEE